MTNRLFALGAALLGSTALAGEYVYDVEIFGQGAPELSTLTLRHDGPRLRIEGSALPFGAFVMDNTKQEASWTLRNKLACYVLPYAKFPDITVQALERYRENVGRSTELTPEQKQQLLTRAQQSIDDAKQRKPTRVLTLTWQKSVKATAPEFPCELYVTREAGEDVGQMCLQVNGKVEKTLEFTVQAGDWWQSMNTFLAARQLPVLLESKSGGVLRHRAKLHSADAKKKVDPALFALGKDCTSGLEMSAPGKP